MRPGKALWRSTSKIVDIAQRNVNAGFDLAKSSAGARTSPTWWNCRRRIGGSSWAHSCQAEEVRALSTKVTAAAGEPINAQVTRGVDGRRKAN